MKKTLFLLVLASCTTMGSHAAAESGVGYLQSVQASIEGRYLCCEWPEEYPGSDEPGAAYKESQAAAEDADCHEDKQEENDQ